MMKISILMITYNHEKFIAQAIESVLIQQANFDYELVIGEDGSSDRTREIALDFQRRYPDKIRVLLTDQNLGMHRNFARTLEACRGQYIALLEGDDYWTSPDKLQKQAEVLDTHPECALCFHQVATLEHEDQQPIVRHKQHKLISNLEDIVRTNFIPTGSVMFRREFLTTFPDWFYTAPVVDWPLFVAVAEHGEIRYLDEVMATYRIHNGGVWSTQSQAKRTEVLIDTCKAINLYLESRYEKTVNLSLAELYTELAHLRYLSGDNKGARLSFAEILNPPAKVDLPYLCSCVAHYAHVIAEREKSNEAGMDFISTLLSTSMLPVEPQHKKKAVAEFHVIAAFKEYAEKNANSVRRHLYVAIRNNWHWLRNRGVLSIGLRSLVGGN
jgi:glycosyltransferase involved in cell wall biosynthesis